MIQYPLGDVLKVRKLREDRANDELLKSKRRVREARVTLKEKEEELAEFKILRDKETTRLWKEVIGTSVSQKELDKFKYELNKLDGKLKTFQESTAKAEKELQESIENEEKARVEYMHRIRERQKIDEHKDIYMEDALFQEERRLEGELSDIQLHGPAHF